MEKYDRSCTVRTYIKTEHTQTRKILKWNQNLEYKLPVQ